MSRRAGNPMLKYASMVLLAWSLSDMAIGLSTKSGYPIVDVLGIYFSGYLFFKSRLVRGIALDVMVFFVMAVMLLFSHAL